MPSATILQLNLAMLDWHSSKNAPLNYRMIEKMLVWESQLNRAHGIKPLKVFLCQFYIQYLQIGLQLLAVACAQQDGCDGRL